MKRKRQTSSASPYDEAAHSLNQIWTQNVGLKSLAFSPQGELNFSKSTYAICSKVLQNQSLLETVLTEAGFLNDKQQMRNHGLWYVLTYELLLGPNKSIRGGGTVKRSLMQAEKQLQAALKKVSSSKSGSLSAVDVDLPRYVRVNALKLTTHEFVGAFQQKHPDIEVFADVHIPDLLVFAASPETREALQPWVQRGEIVLQDKSSCFSALCLVHACSFDSRAISATKSSPGLKNTEKVGYLDACAAPGNKTSHLAALLAKLKPSAKTKEVVVHALDRSPSRFAALEKRMEHLGGQKSTVSIHCHQQDFLQSNVPDPISGILLDPSCSGSGMTTATSAADTSRDPWYRDDRVDKLSRFQVQALQYAMKHENSANSPLQRIVYSTCSLYVQENEAVVAQALKECGENWELIAPHCLTTWHRRGLSTTELEAAQASKCVRVDPFQGDPTNGFFVACFQRRRASEYSMQQQSEWKGWTPPKNIEFYTGNEFQKPTKLSPSTTSTPTPPDTRSADKTSTTDSTQPAAAVGNKKRAKKMEWKRRQAEQKRQRLLGAKKNQ